MGYVVIVGGGELGKRFIEKFLDKDWKVVVIDENIKVCNDIIEEYGIKTINGDGTDPKVLEEAEVGKSDVFIAVTPNEEKNILSSFLAKERGAKRIIVRLSSQKYIKIVNELGFEYIFPEEMIENLFYNIAFPNMIKMCKYSDFYLAEIKVDERLNIIGKSVKALEKSGVKIIYYKDGEELKEASPDDIIREGVILYIITKKDPAEVLKSWLI